ncbi:Piwi-domain-containing protein [Dichomitus squalens LYAD-421 SS1]|uniref:Piwi-domain-containing protein n=1 Tax=Dichomitus squalens TaxID=114155 RepID=A0A4V2KA10_9APHY|nr:Piwi-domain-containing protein [Dichomitus squalens LYAD-421 SS1]EJF65736.1 Piwi-domain-containing protein [Dichomitus squalens LYAD-421 SS1]TBU65978.1 Piwi-domain-containing protein [Dichomitus squalens]
MLTRRRDPHDPHDTYAKSLSLLQLLVRQAPNLRHGYRAHIKAFFVEHGSKELGSGLIARRGFFQSIRPTPGRLMVNVDTVCGLVYEHRGRLIDVMAAWLRLKDPRDLNKLQRHEYADLRSFLKGVRVTVTVSPEMKPKPIADLVERAALQEFDTETERLNVKTHFERKYNVKVVHEHAVGVRLGRSAIIPAELCKIVPGQLFKRKVPAHLQPDFLKFATQRPDQRLRAIRAAVGGNPSEQQFDYANSDFLREAGMTVDVEPISLPSQIIGPPPIQFGSRQFNGALDSLVPTGGSWNLRDKRFWRPGSNLKIWAVINFDRVEERQMHEFLRTLVANLRKLAQWVLQDLNNAYGVMKAQCAPGEEPQLVLVFLPNSATECRRDVKHWGDISTGVSTQCVRGGKWNGPRMTPNQLDQYCNNLALKINVRLMGVNSMIDSPLTKDILHDSMVIGADVGHPGPGVATRPSMTGLVATVSPGAAFAASYASVQHPRLEMIQDLAHMIEAYREKEMHMKKSPPPKNIFFYRDGVSEGEFEQVAQYEIPLIKGELEYTPHPHSEAFRKSKIPEQHHPRLLFVIVGKRHHVRFFPKSPQDADKSGNCPSGLLVDDHITNPNYEDFYLQSHSGLLGTSRPTHYVVLANETGLDSKTIQLLTYHLCHMYASATRAVSIPAPVYCEQPFLW